MASTAHLKIVKPVSEHDPNKIVTLNDEADDLDKAVAGFTSISIAGSGSTTLSRAQAINKAIKFTGVLTGARTILLPVSLGSGREFIVWNATSGAFSLTIKTDTGGSAGVAVTSGTKSLLAHDGTDVFAVVSGGGGAGDALVADPLSQFAATTSAQLAGVMTDETGTDKLVYSASPALTGTPTAPTAAAGTNTTQLATTAHVFAERANTVTLTNKTLTTPTIGSFANAAHDHDDAAGGAQLNATNVFSAGTVPTARLGSGTANSTTFLRGDQTWQTPAGTGDVTAAANFATDNVVIRADGTGKGVQLSAVTIADTTGNLSTPGSVTTGSAGGVTGNHAISGSSSGTANLSVAAAAGTGTFLLPVTAGGTFSLGYLNIPQNSKSAAYTLVLEDDAKHIYHPGADTTARIWTIPANSSVAFPVGTAITFVNDTSAGVITLSITSDVLVWMPTGGTGSRTLAANSVATAMKVTSTRWVLTGVGIT